MCVEGGVVNEVVCLFIYLSDAMCVEGGIVNVGYSEVVCSSICLMPCVLREAL